MITKELQNKLVTCCQHPRTVVNKYTHESVVVSCGHCPSCILRRSAVQTNLLTTYSAQFRYVYFVTLTYAPCFLPTLEVSLVELCTDDIADVPTFVSFLSPILMTWTLVTLILIFLVFAAFLVLLLSS